MLSATFDDWGGGANANDPAFSVDLTRSTAIFHRTEILQIIRENCYTSQGDPDSSFPLWFESRPTIWQKMPFILIIILHNYNKQRPLTESYYQSSLIDYQSSLVIYPKWVLSSRLNQKFTELNHGILALSCLTIGQLILYL